MNTALLGVLDLSTAVADILDGLWDNATAAIPIFGAMVVIGIATRAFRKVAK